MITHEVVSIAVGIAGLLGAFFAVIRVSLRLQSVALEQVADLRQSMALQKVQSVDSDKLTAALDRVLAVFERRMDQMENSLRATAHDVHSLRIAVAVLNDREQVTDFSAANRKTMEGASRG